MLPALFFTWGHLRLTFGNDYLGHHVTILEGSDHLLTTGDLAKNSMFAIEMGLGGVTDEELGTIGIGTGIGHTQATGFVDLPGITPSLVFKAVAGSAPTITPRAAPLGHKSGNDPMEGQTIVKVITSQKNEVVDRFGDIRGKQIELNVSLLGFDGGQITFGGINHHVRIATIFFWHNSLLCLNVQRLYHEVATMQVRINSKQWSVIRGRFNCLLAADTGPIGLARPSE